MLTCPVMTGRPLPPSVLLSAVVSVYTQPLVSVIELSAEVVFAVDIAEIRLVTEQGTTALIAAVLVPARLPTAAAASPPATAIRNE